MAGARRSRASIPAAKPAIATRSAGAATMAAFQPYFPTMVGGCADLVASTGAVIQGAGTFARVFAGRNVPFGIREHGMGAIVNGLALHGGVVKPFGSTFLVFADYMRPAIRLSALMGLPVVWAFTHDSVAVGEDGPTHQPVEQVASLRTIPGLWVIRPADANETVVAWRVALERTDGPVALALTRQDVPVLDRVEMAAPDGLERGAYTLWESPGANGSLDLLLLATGSEVSLALDAGRELAADGWAVRVVSMPCWELFDAQPREYRDEVLPPDVGARLAVEAGISLGWHRFVGDRGDIVSIERYGASAPGPTVLAELGLTTGAVRRARPRARRGPPARLLKEERMPKSPLHALADHGQSVWCDNLSRELLESGELARLVREDAVVGVTSNPTIFQKALAAGDAYDEQLRAVLAETNDPKELFVRLAAADVGRRVRSPAPGVGADRRAGRLRLDRGRSDARLRHRGDDRGGDPAARADRPAQPARQDPRHEARPARDRGHDREGQVDQRHPDLLARALRGGRGGLPARARAPRRGGRRPRLGRVGGELLRLARRHGDRPAPRGARRA